MQWTEADVRSALTEGLNKMFDSRGKALKPQYPSTLKELKSPTGIYIDRDSAFFGLTQRKKEKQGYTYDTPVFGNKLELEAKGYGLAFLVTMETLILMMKRPHGDWSTQEFVSYGNVTKKFRDSALQRKEALAAKIFTLGDTTTASDDFIGAGRDGVALFGTHSTLKNPATAWQNIRSGSSLDQAELAAMVLQIMTAPSPEGFQRGAGNSFQIECGVNQMFRAYEVINSTKQPDSANNQDNYLNQFSFSVHVNQHYGSDNLFALLDKGNTNLVYMEPVPDKFGSHEDYETGGQRISIYHQFLAAFLDPYGISYNPGL